MSHEQTIPGLAATGACEPALVTIGVFDGVHLGHQQLLARLVARARAAKLRAVVVTFFPHPDIVLRGLRGRYYLSTPEEKVQRLRATGVDEVLTLALRRCVAQGERGDFLRTVAAETEHARAGRGARLCAGSSPRR